MLKTIDEVITELEKIKAECRTNNSTLGFFALLYCEVTKSVKQGITDEKFEDNSRMERLDILFANRYIDAYRLFQKNENVSTSWLVAFQSSQEPLLILQHIFLGINAHINLDLGIAAAETMSGKNVEDINNDFNSINAVLGEMIDSFQERLNTASPFFKWIDKLAGSKEEMLALPAVKQWLLTQAIAGQLQTAGFAVPERHGKHADAALQRGFKAPNLDSGQQRFRIGMSAPFKTVSALLQLPAQCGMVVDLAIE